MAIGWRVLIYTVVLVTWAIFAGGMIGRVIPEELGISRIPAGQLIWAGSIVGIAALTRLAIFKLSTRRASQSQPPA